MSQYETAKHRVIQFAACALVLLLTSCGGAGVPDAANADIQEVERAVASGVSAPANQAKVSALVKLAEVPVQGTVVDLTYSVQVKNGLPAQTGVTVTLLAVGTGTSIIDGTATIGYLAACSAIATSVDTITLRHDKALPLDLAALRWQVMGNPDSVTGSVGLSGGSLTVPSGRIALNIPQGALAVTQKITVAASDCGAAVKANLGNFSFDFRPSSTVLKLPVEISAMYDPLSLPLGATENDITLAYVDGSILRYIPSLVDPSRRLVIGEAQIFRNYYVYTTLTTVPEYTVRGIQIPRARWARIPGSTCVRSDNQAYFDRVAALSKLLFGLPETTNFDTYIGNGCVTGPYLEDGYSLVTFDPEEPGKALGLENHGGIDFKGPSGTPVFAPLDGEVIYEKLDVPKKRSTLIIQSTIDGLDYWLFYIHCESHMGLKAGDPVGKDDQVCQSGSVGAGAAHLHFEVKLKDQDGGSLRAIDGSHCPNSSFNRYNPAGGRFDLHTAPGCGWVDIAARTLDPTALIPGASGRLNDTGITANQCYAAGSDNLVPCNSPAAIALNDQQDGMVGRDVANNDNSDGKAGFSFSLVPRPSGGYYDKTECVRDNVTGQIWEGKTANGGVRDGTRAYTNWGDGRPGDSSAYVIQVNATVLCGYTDWRLPKVRELQAIVDYGVPFPGPTIDMDWFPNTQRYVYWSSFPFAGYADGAWVVYFYDGSVFDFPRFNGSHVRLVR